MLLYSIITSERCDAVCFPKARSEKGKKASGFFAKTLYSGALTIRNSIVLSPPYCEKDQTSPV